MSLINEALKRTRDTAHQGATARGSDVSQYRLTNGAQPISFSSRTTVVATLVIGSLVVVAIVALTGRFIMPARKVQDAFVHAPQLEDVDAQRAAWSTTPEKVAKPTADQLAAT